MKVSEVTREYLANYLRLDDPGDVELHEIENFMLAAKQYIISYTGLTEQEVNEYEDITTAFLILVADMFDNRNLYIEGKASNINKTLECILGFHSVNLL